MQRKEGAQLSHLGALQIGVSFARRYDDDLGMRD
jgi:hypothetical protein